ncbi:hypothetical protein [Streptomyces sp.]|uniref:hypothetical protein n=1 Tax=Streptomyces sp. TaxID=1931 RepID=UPI002D751313|nr:hypothetical protein [Streptomyces sp.]HZF92062.1 hypothetical protein [Streptomyces sp.]
MRRQLALWAARTTAADRLCRGSALVWQRRTDALTAWVRAGRRDDLDGWRAALGPLLRLAVLGAAAYALWAVVRALPWLMWLLVGWWIRAAWKAGTTAAPAADDEASAEPDLDAVRALLLEAMGTADAVHLRTVLAHLQEQGHGKGWKVADLRARLEALHIPVQPKVKVPGSKSPTRGVRRADLAPSPAVAGEMSTAPSTAA